MNKYLLTARSYTAFGARLIALLLLTTTTGAFASNFSYSYLGVDSGQIRTDEELDFFGDIYQDFDTLELTGSMQIGEQVAVAIYSGSASEEKQNSEIKLGEQRFTLAFPIALGDRADIVPVLGGVRSVFEGCVGGFCANDTETGALFGLGVRLWAVPDRLEANLSVEDATLDNADHVISVGAALWFGHRHSIRLAYLDQSDQSQTAIGYRYTWR